MLINVDTECTILEEKKLGFSLLIGYYFFYKAVCSLSAECGSDERISFECESRTEPRLS